MQQISDRQSAIEDDCAQYNPFLVFAEGTTTNGSGLMKFKRGAFYGMRTVVPVYIKLGQRYLMSTYDVVAFWPYLVLYFSSFAFQCVTVTIMPEFTPTQWMLDNHAEKGSADWEVFAECVREVMVKHGGFTKEDRPIREKLAYEAFMNGEKETCELDGRVFTHSNQQGEDKYNAIRANSQ